MTGEGLREPGNRRWWSSESHNVGGYTGDARSRKLAAVSTAIDSLPNDIEALKRLVLEREAALEIERHNVRAQRTLIEHLKLQIARLKRLQFGQRSEKLQAQIEQFELIVEDLEESQAQQAPATVTESKPAKQPVRKRPAKSS